MDTTFSQGPARPLTDGERAAVQVVAVLVAVLGLLGFVNSFAGVRTAVEPSFGSMAWTVPLGIDVGIAVFSALDIVLARLNMRLRWLRLIPWALTAATVYLNGAHQPTTFDAVAHAVLPCLWVVTVEVAAHVIRVRARLVAPDRMDAIRRSRWLLAPLATLKLWRRMVLWEIRSYPAALDRERARLLALTDLQDAHGTVAWRWKAPRRARALYRLGELAPAVEAAGPDRSADHAPDRSGDRSQATRKAGPRPAKTRRADRSRTTASLLAEARRLNGEHRKQTGRPISGTALASKLRIGKSRANELARTIRNEGPPLAVVAGGDRS